MMRINCMIVDDEPIARDILAAHIEHTAGLTLAKSCINAMEAYEGLHEHRVDLVFLDIQMPVITGTDFLKSLRNPPLVIFTTAYSQYAVEGFELNAVDYLLKPVTYERFYQAIQKVKERLTSKSDPLLPVRSPVDYLFIRQDLRLIRVNYDQIDYIQAERDYSFVFTGEKRLLASMHLKIFEDLLPKEQFVRVHRSYIVHLSKVKAIKGNRVELENAEIPIGTVYRDALLDALRISG